MARSPRAAAGPFDPRDAVGEILGRRAAMRMDPTATDYLCPYVGSRCNKSVRNGTPYPVCSVMNPAGMIAVCPKRLYQRDVMADVIKHCWPGDKPPKHPEVAAEVQMEGFGNVDFVIADRLADGKIGQFLSVEVQAIDITGSVREAYDAVLSGTMMRRRPTWGMNWDNVYKRYVTQLIRKGYFHHHWGTKIVAVMQDVVYQNVVDRFDFLRTEKVRDKAVNVIFVTYRHEPDPNVPGEFRMALGAVEGTSHANLQQAVLYAKAPSRDEFAGRIEGTLRRMAAANVPPTAPMPDGAGDDLEAADTAD